MTSMRLLPAGGLTLSAGFELPPTEDCPWMAVAMREVGTKEKRGAGDNPQVVKYLKSCDTRFFGSAAEQNHDETSWCSCFVNWCLGQVGIAGTKHPRARSWLRWGLGRRIPGPRFGAIAVLTRSSDHSLAETGKGHVAFLWQEIGESLYLLGGNQSDAVKIQPYKKSNLLMYLWPAQPVLPRGPGGLLTPPSSPFPLN